MNSVEALEFALHILRNRQRRLTTLGTPESNPTAEAIETLDALRELIADNGKESHHGTDQRNHHPR